MSKSHRFIRNHALVSLYLSCSLALFLAVLFLPTNASAFSGGPPDHVAGDPPDYANCTLCHNQFPINSGPGSVQINGLPASYTPGTTYTFTVTTAQSGQMRWGFELTVIKADGSRGGQLVVTDPTNTQMTVNGTYNRDFMKHTLAGTFPATPTSHTWTMNWTAPLAGTGMVTFFVAGNAADNNGTNQGDYIYLANFNLPQAGALPPYKVTLSPIGSPIPQIPAAGGSFNFNAGVIRNSGAVVPFTVWGRIKNPNGTYTPPTLGPIAINPPLNVSVSRIRTQNVPNTWSTGFYTYLGYANSSFTYPAVDSGWFYFTKLATLSDAPLVWDATCYGEPFPYEVTETPTPTTFTLIGASPNPFNPTTTVSFTLPEAARVILNVYDLQGRLVTSLVNGTREAGVHHVAFDGSNLTSGVYLYTLQAGSYSAAGKMILMK